MIAKSEKNIFKILSIFSLYAVLLAEPVMLHAQVSEDQLDLSAVLYLEEITPGGKSMSISSTRHKAIVGIDSRLKVRFYTANMEEAIELDSAKSKWEELKNKLQGNVEQPVKNIQELMTLGQEQIILKSKGYEISISARVYPQKGEPFDLAVNGYTSVETQENNDTGRTVTTSMDLRPLRVEINALTDEIFIKDDITDAVIELPEDKLTSGDRIEINVTNHFGTAPQRLTWRLKVLDTGLHVKQDATLLLVKRSQETKKEGQNGSDGDIDNELELESNFKPAPGSSFLFKLTTRNSTINFIDPSIGINGSFLDFRSDKDLEIGIGPVFSVFNGILQVSVGWNLNVDSDRFYWSLGLGFLDIAGKLKERSH